MAFVIFIFLLKKKTHAAKPDGNTFCGNDAQEEEGNELHFGFTNSAEMGWTSSNFHFKMVSVP
jgi:hypothetical protein